MSVRILYGENQKPKTVSNYDPQEKNEGGGQLPVILVSNNVQHLLKVLVLKVLVQEVLNIV